MPPRHIAFVTSLVPPARPQSGFAIANRAVVDGLRALGHRVSVVGAALPNDEMPKEADTHVLTRMAIENAHVGAGTKLRWLAAALRHGVPYASAKMIPVTNDAATRLDRVRPDVVVLNSYQLATSVLRRRPFIYLAHNVESHTAAQNAAVGSGVEAMLYRRDARILRRLENDLTDAAAWVWTLTAEDRDGFALDADRCGTLPLIVPRTSRERTAAKAFDIVLIGTWTWTANAAGLRWFLEAVTPRLPPDFRVAVAGSVPRELHGAHPRVNFLGRVEDAQGFLDQGHVVPLVARGGTGVQLKTIEAFQCGRATVATRSSLRGIGEPPPNCHVADEPAAFALALTEFVRRGRSGEAIDRDGTDFYEAQRAALHAALDRGVDRAMAAEGTM